MTPNPRSEGAQAKVQRIVKIVGSVLNIPESELMAETRKHAPTALGRQICMYFANTAGDLSLTEVGRQFGRDRTTVAHACRKVEDLRDQSEEHEEWFEVFERLLSLNPFANDNDLPAGVAAIAEAPPQPGDTGTRAVIAPAGRVPAEPANDAADPANDPGAPRREDLADGVA